MINREESLKLVKSKIPNKNLIKHMLATEVIMRALAKRLGGDQEKWALAGLVHDVDYMETEQNPKLHARMGSELLASLDYPEDIVQAVLSHNEMNGSKRTSIMDEALYTSDPLTGLIVACALIHPDKILASLDTDFILNRFKEKRFAAGANREQIQNCEKLGLSLEDFITLGLIAMQEISNELGL